MSEDTRRGGSGVPEAASGAGGGAVLAAGTVVLVAFMAMHPTVEAHDTAGFVSGVSRISLLTGLVHGTLIGAFGLILLGLWTFAERLGLHRLSVRAGLVAWTLGAIALAAAAVVNGFIVPALAARYAGADAAALERLRSLLLLCHETNGAVDRLGIVALSAAVVLWSAALLPRRPAGQPALGAAGLVCGALPVLALSAGHLPMNVHGFGAFVLVQAAWYLAVAVQLVRGRL